MLQRPVDSSRYRGTARPDKTVRWAVDELEKVEELRGRPPESWPSATALPESLDRLAGLLTELGWDDLASLARREQLTVYRELEAARPGGYSGEIAHVRSALRRDLVALERYAEALEVVEEQLRRPGTGRSAQAAAREARGWRTLLLARLGRHEEAVESAAEAVAELRERRERQEDASADSELAHALAVYADRLDDVGRVAEAAEVGGEVVAYWRGRSDSTVRYLTTVDVLSERLLRSGRAEEAGACITEAMRKVRRRRSHLESAGTWHHFSRRLLSVDLADRAAKAGEEAVRLYRELAHWAHEHRRKVEAADDWDDDHRYAEWYLLRRRHEELASAHEGVLRADRNLRAALRTLSSCLRRLDRVDEAAAAEAEAAALSRPAARPSGEVPPDPT
jgi:tetratricopeptide (TPR) repeat protein